MQPSHYGDAAADEEIGMSIYGMCALAFSLMCWAFAWVMGTVWLVWPFLVLGTVLPLLGAVLRRTERRS